MCLHLGYGFVGGPNHRGAAFEWIMGEMLNFFDKIGHQGSWINHDGV